MQQIIPGKSVKELDAAFIKDKGITSYKLMEQAALAFCDWFVEQISPENDLAVFCGTGNNGGDGMAISRLLWERGYSVKVFIMGDPANGSKDFKLNHEVLPEAIPVQLVENVNWENWKAKVIIDGVLGVGINRPLEGAYLDLIKRLNNFPAKRIAIDMPTGLPSDEILEGEAFKAMFTVSFQFPKMALLFPEHASYTGELVIKDIGISPDYFETFEPKMYYLEKKDIPELHKSFDRFSHKGNFGKVMLIGGSYGKMGAVRMASEAALRTGSGLVSCFVPRCGIQVLQSSLPEAMVEVSEQDHYLDEYPPDNLTRYDALGVGPGMGQHSKTAIMLEELLKLYKGPMVIDADGINLLASHPHLLNMLGHNIILTPHLKEFERLAGACAHQRERVDKVAEFVEKFQCTIILKGAHSLIACPDGTLNFNSSGNAYLATGGAGDVLTGMITSFLGQGYSPKEAAFCGVYHHGLAGELAGKVNRRGTIASDIIAKIPQTYLQLGIH
ncbi:NAD(P)H-hydrate dehydratase [Echinicola jeungdonensis]|uniref:Bifunctional NAD(P)H-hydrate repair enzyme n=1 Tax=Echinicola jeungdonensis TaxID=709343 RepID=A0ABV5J570_9BACT|nr:NAD(P)H-hydrate dehydratase [Echinicola jeungdonensis]MDN3668178.1 NAD(P)H-hydrate dehydratase [Echinicola jeungdonensis]